MTSDIERIIAEVAPLGALALDRVTADDIMAEYLRVLASPRAARWRVRGDEPRVNARIVIRFTGDGRGGEDIFSEFSGAAHAIVRWFEIERERLYRTVPDLETARLDLGIG